MQHIIQSSNDIFCWVTSTVMHVMKVPPVMNRMTSCSQLSVVSVPILIFFSCCFWKLFHFLCALRCLSLLCVKSSSFFQCSLSFHLIPALFWRLVPLMAFSFFFTSFLCSTLLLSRLTSPVPWYMHGFFQSLCACLVFLDCIAFRCGLKIGQTCVIVHCFYYCFCK